MMRFQQAFLALAAVCAVVVTAPIASAQRTEPLRININQGNIDPVPVAVPALIAADSPEAATIGQNISNVIISNFDSSAVLRPIDQAAYIEQIADFDAAPRFQDWRLIGAQLLVTGQADINREGDLIVSFRLWDTVTQRQLAGLRYDTTVDNWRRIAHQISDQVYTRLTGEDGYFDTRIVYIEESGSKINLRTRLTIMDQDGANRQYLTDGEHFVFLPAFSPSLQQIVYISYREGAPKTYLFDLQTRRHEALFEISQDAESYSARFTPDGTRVVTTVSVRGNSDIHMFDLRSRQLTRLTREPSIEVEPSMDPEGRRIVFTSDRSGPGQRQLYVMNLNGGAAERISFGQGRYGTPVWSPRGDLIAFTKQSAGRFELGVMRPDGSGERILTQSYKIDRPTWSPNGRILLYTSEQPGEELLKQIRSIDLTGYNEKVIATAGAASDPAWSPVLR